MKDLKIVLWILLPLVLAIGGMLALDRYSGPPVEPDEPDRPGRPMPPGPREGGGAGSGRTLYVGPPAGIIPTDRPAPVAIDNLTDLNLTLDRARALIAANSWQSWAELRELLLRGVVEDPMGITALLIEALSRGGNDATHAYVLIPLIRDPNARLKAAEDLLALAVESEDPQVLKAALGTLGQVGGADQVSRIADLARLHQSQEIFAQAVYALAEIGSEEALSELGRFLVEKDDPNLLSQVKKAIRRASSAEMVAVLAPMTGDGNPPEVRKRALQSLGESGRPEAVETLVGFARSEGDPVLAEIAVDGLGRVGNDPAAKELLRLHLEGGVLAQRAGYALEHVSGKDAEGTLLEALEGVEDGQVRERVVRALGRAGGDESKERLRGLLESREETGNIRGQAARSLAALGDPAAVKPMMEVLRASQGQDRQLSHQMVFAVQEMVRHGGVREELLAQGIPAMRQVIERTTQDDSLHHYAYQTLRMLEAAQPRGEGAGGK